MSETIVLPRLHDDASVDGLTDAAHPAWLDSVRATIAGNPGHYLVYLNPEGAPAAYRLHRRRTRIGRSLASQIRFEDPTVSRRHVLVAQEPGRIELFDDRSCNGVFLNGERVERSVLEDGDQLVVGRHHLYFVEVSATDLAAPVEPACASSPTPMRLLAAPIAKAAREPYGALELIGRDDPAT